MTSLVSRCKTAVLVTVAVALSVLPQGLVSFPVGPVTLAPLAPMPSASASQVFRTLVLYTPPVSDPVIDDFRPPSTPYGAGNRGLEYGNPADTPVFAAAGGSVIFAGPIAYTYFVVIRHLDGIETTYSYLSELLVEEYDSVESGEQIAVAGPNLHFGARSGAHYVDPQILLDASEPVERPLLTRGPS